MSAVFSFFTTAVRFASARRQAQKSIRAHLVVASKQCQLGEVLTEGGSILCLGSLLFSRVQQPEVPAILLHSAPYRWLT